MTLTKIKIQAPRKYTLRPTGALVSMSFFHSRVNKFVILKMIMIVGKHCGCFFNRKQLLRNKAFFAKYIYAKLIKNIVIFNSHDQKDIYINIFHWWDAFGLKQNGFVFLIRSEEVWTIGRVTAGITTMTEAHVFATTLKSKFWLWIRPIC